MLPKRDPYLIAAGDAPRRLLVRDTGSRFERLSRRVLTHRLTRARPQAAAFRASLTRHLAERCFLAPCRAITLAVGTRDARRSFDRGRAHSSVGEL